MKTNLTSTQSAENSLHCLSGGGTDAALVTGASLIDVLAAAVGTELGKASPEWIKISPRGRFTARDGRSFEVNPEVLAARFAAEGVDLPIDLDHATVLRQKLGETAPAIGWINELSARPDGLYGRVEWLDKGLAILAARTHRYVSPAFKAPESGVVEWLHSAGLVAAPALPMPAVASAAPNSQQDKPMSNKIAIALGLVEAADETACLSAIATLKADHVDKAVHEQTIATLSATTQELNALKKQQRDAKVHAVLEDALQKKKMTPAQRPQFELLCASDDGLAQVEALLDVTAPGLTPSGLDQQKPPAQLATLSADDHEMIKTLGYTEEEYRKANGLTVA